MCHYRIDNTDNHFSTDWIVIGMRNAAVVCRAHTRTRTHTRTQYTSYCVYNDLYKVYLTLYSVHLYIHYIICYMCIMCESPRLRPSEICQAHRMIKSCDDDDNMKCTYIHIYIYHMRVHNINLLLLYVYIRADIKNTYDFIISVPICICGNNAYNVRHIYQYILYTNNVFSFYKLYTGVL